MDRPPLTRRSTTAGGAGVQGGRGVGLMSRNGRDLTRRFPGRSRGAPSRRPSPRLLSRRPKGLQLERLELGGRQRDPWDGVNPAPRESLPRPFDLRNRDTGLPQEVSEQVEPLAPGLAASKRAVQWREGDPV